MTIMELLKTAVSDPYIVTIAICSLIEIAPIKVNPWSKLFKWIGNALNHDLDKKLSDLKKDFEDKKANDMRWDILSFANSCRRGNQHSKDEWWHAMSQLAEYEQYTEAKHIVNGVIESDAEYLRELYHERNMKNDFL